LYEHDLVEDMKVTRCPAMSDARAAEPDIPAEGVVLGVDYGRVRVGLARSDGAQVTSLAIGFVRRTSDQQVAEAVCAIARSETAIAVVIGEPLHTDGGAGANSRWIDSFIQALRQAGLGIPIIRWDERLSTQEAASRMLRRGARAGSIDAESARVILERWLHRRSS
jgi:putative Holliday junction resolvase